MVGTSRTQVSYARLFDRLLDCIPRDVLTLKAQYAFVRRPQVLLSAGGPPTDPDAWRARHRRLVDRLVMPAAPDIVAWGVGGASPQTMAEVASRREYAFSITQFSTFIRSYVLTHGRAILDGQSPPGFPPLINV
jgi:hypothetical protein